MVDNPAFKEDDESRRKKDDIEMTPAKKNEDEDEDEEGDENPERGNWSGKLDFLLSCLGYAVGLGNLWRFPYLCFKNGGGAFLVPYVLFLFLCGVPLFFLEVCWGQFCGCGPIPAWNVMPLLKGVGYCAVTLSFAVTIYYNVIITWTLYYFFASFTSKLPYSDCSNSWNSEYCSTKVQELNGSWVDGEYTFDNNGTLSNYSYDLVANAKTPSNEFFMLKMLNKSDGLGTMGVISWQLLLCLALAWVIVFLCILKGIKSAGKVVYFTATFPYFVLLILLIRGATLPGAADGLKFYLIPKFDRLGDFGVWGDAAIQIFYSLGPGWGGLLTFASYNKFKHNCMRDAIIVSIANSATSMYAGMAIFSIVGYLSYKLNVNVADVAASGPSLAFEAYPEALAKLPGAPFWAFIFFFMLITLGLDSQFGMMEGVISALSDEYPRYLRKYKMLFTALLCVLCFFLGLPFISQGGIYLFTLWDTYVGGMGLLTACILECVGITWVYGWDNFSLDIEMMLGKKPIILWRILWQFVTPFTCLFVLGISYYGWGDLSYDNYVYPSWAHGIGWMVAVIPVSMIPIFMVVEYLKADGTFRERMKYLISPTKRWGPALNKFRGCERYPKFEEETNAPGPSNKVSPVET